MIVRSLQMLGSKGLGATLTTNEQTDYLYALNSMLDSWSTERLLVYQVSEGWGPLCDFLGVARPEGDMPHVNTTQEFQARLSA